jgi:hypothetical protein
MSAAARAGALVAAALLAVLLAGCYPEPTPPGGTPTVCTTYNADDPFPVVECQRFPPPLSP